MSEGYKELPHTADIYYEAWGPNLEAVFRQIGLAVFDTMTDVKKIEHIISKKIKIEAEDIASLLFEFIRELLYLLDVDEVLFSGFDLEIIKSKSKYVLKGDIKGEKFNPKKHISKTEVKAPTYSQLEIIKSEKGIIIRFVLDI